MASNAPFTASIETIRMSLPGLPVFGSIGVRLPSVRPSALLVTHSVRHSGVAAGAELMVRLRVWQDSWRIEVEDPGHDGVIAPR